MGEVIPLTVRRCTKNQRPNPFWSLRYRRTRILHLVSGMEILQADRHNGLGIADPTLVVNHVVYNLLTRGFHQC